jgi:uncharacterized protein (DUF427 family)
LPSSRNIRIEIGGQTVAESAACMLLYETSLPVRYYMPKTSVSVLVICGWVNERRKN